MLTQQKVAPKVLAPFVWAAQAEVEAPAASGTNAACWRDQGQQVLAWVKCWSAGTELKKVTWMGLELAAVGVCGAAVAAPQLQHSYVA